MKKVLILIFTLIVFNEINAVEFEAGIKSGGSSYYPADFTFRRRYDLYNFYIPKEAGSSNINAVENTFFFKVTSESGKFSSYSQFTNGNGDFTYSRQDPLLFVILSSYFRNSSGLALAGSASKSNVHIRTGRRDFFSDGIYYILPDRFGVGLGYRYMRVYSNSDQISLFRFVGEVDHRVFNTSGLQFSLYGNIPLDKNGRVSMSIRGSYFNLSGQFEQSYSIVSVSETLTPIFYLQSLWGNPIANRRGYEVDLAFNVPVAPKLKDNLNFFVGMIYQESSVSVKRYGYLGFDNTAANIQPLLNNYGYSQLVERPIFANDVVDRFLTIYIGASVKYNTSPKKETPEVN